VRWRREFSLGSIEFCGKIQEKIGLGSLEEKGEKKLPECHRIASGTGCILSLTCGEGVTDTGEVKIFRLSSALRSVTLGTRGKYMGVAGTCENPIERFFWIGGVTTTEY